MSDLTKLNCQEFLKKLSSNAPTPGGGGGAAMAGALAAALTSMVGNLTVGKKKFAENEAEVKEIHQKLTPAFDKVTLSKPTADDIWSNINIGPYTVTKANSGVLMISLPVSINKPFDLDVPEGVNMVMDGTLKGEVWFEDRYVGNVFFPLPVFGIAYLSSSPISAASSIAHWASPLQDRLSHANSLVI